MGHGMKPANEALLKDILSSRKSSKGDYEVYWSKMHEGLLRAFDIAGFVLSDIEIGHERQWAVYGDPKARVMTLRITLTSLPFYGERPEGWPILSR
jgi:hypothetical protein